MSTLKLTFQSGEVQEHPLGDGQLLIRLEPSGGISAGTFQGGVFSASELKAIELPVFVASAPPPSGPPRLKEVEYDLTPRDTDGRAWGPRQTFRAMAHDDAWDEPTPPPKPKPKRKPKEAG